MNLKPLPGWAVLVILSLLSLWLSQLVVVGGKHPLEASALVIILGMLIANRLCLPAILEPGFKGSEKLLAWGIVLMGASLDLSKVFAESASILLIILCTMVIGGAATFAAARIFALSRTFSWLLALGTVICGGTAIAVAAPLIRAKDEETSYAVATISLWGLLALFLYPAFAAALGVSDFSFGVFAGTSIHSTPQVVGAGFIYSELAGNTATAIKLVRNCFIAPAALLAAIWFQSNQVGGGISPGRGLLRAFPWFLFGFFLMSILYSRGVISPSQGRSFSEAGKFLILLGMAGVGVNTKLANIVRSGLRPLLVGLIGALTVALTSAALIYSIL
ncbi:MAG: hypothetical protein DCC75_02970 [Proteobacteria bacterium]|nr:MAG: hypothetical protein DCC75_02970 [Pseudomonadota bacterium]